ncbi:hypothetical protein MMC17_009729 [Xylographa soralifera]|nr:hypothetical protein [Xylographa soralifera]
MPPTNRAAWLTAKSAKPLQVSAAPYTHPGPGEIVVKNAAVAINPIDWIKQLMGNVLLGYMKYPFVPGTDVAGQVVEIGSGVERFRVGDRVLGTAMGTAPSSKKPSEGAFQQYTVLRPYVVSTIPAWISYDEACVVPLGLATAAYGLFHKDFLALDFPTVPPRPPSPAGSGKAVVITGGSSSVGCNAIQLAVSAGYHVYSTASPKNHPYLEKLGATRIFDYRSPTLLNDLLDALRGQTLAGAYSVGTVDAVELCDQVLRRHGNTSKKFIALAGLPFPPEQISTTLGTVSFVSSVIWLLLKKAAWSIFTGVHVSWIDSKDMGETDGVAGRIYRDFLPAALEARQFVPAPKPLIVGNGLEHIQEAMDIQMKGVSAQKVVVTL